MTTHSEAPEHIPSVKSPEPPITGLRYLWDDVIYTDGPKLERGREPRLQYRQNGEWKDVSE